MGDSGSEWGEVVVGKNSSARECGHSNRVAGSAARAAARRTAEGTGGADLGKGGLGAQPPARPCLAGGTERQEEQERQQPPLGAAQGGVEACKGEEGCKGGAGAA